MLAHRYCVDCKQTYNELSKIIQGVLASRRELVKFDQKVEMGGGLPSLSDEEEGAEGLPESGSATLVLSPRTKVYIQVCVIYRRSGYFHQQNISLVKFSHSLIFVAYTNVYNTLLY